MLLRIRNKVKWWDKNYYQSAEENYIYFNQYLKKQIKDVIFIELYRGVRLEDELK